MKVTITRGLATLKLLDKKINDSIRRIDVVDLYQRRNNKVGQLGISVEEYNKRAKSDFNSIISLISERSRIKRGILLSNSKTKVKIGNNEMTVIEAIEMKTEMAYKKELLNELKKDLIECKAKVESFKIGLEQKVEQLVLTQIGTNKKIDKETYDIISKPFIEANEYLLCDPIGIEKVIKDLEDEYNNFITEIDFILSESNAKTEIEI